MKRLNVKGRILFYAVLVLFLSQISSERNPNFLVEGDYSNQTGWVLSKDDIESMLVITPDYKNIFLVLYPFAKDIELGDKIMFSNLDLVNVFRGKNYTFYYAKDVKVLSHDFNFSKLVFSKNFSKNYNGLVDLSFEIIKDPPVPFLVNTSVGGVKLYRMELFVSDSVKIKRIPPNFFFTGDFSPDNDDQNLKGIFFGSDSEVIPFFYVLEKENFI